MLPSSITLKKVDQNSKIARKGRYHIHDSIFVTKKRKKELLQKYTSFWKVKTQQDNISLCLVLPDSENVHKYHPLLKITLWRVWFMRTLAGNKKHIWIWIWPTEWKKEYPITSQYLTEDHLNSGSTTTYLDGKNNNGEICIWRTQEFPKVLVHELVHALHLDAAYPKQTEAYTEYMAVLANIYLELLERRLPLQLVKPLLEDEKKYGMYQAQKIQGYDTGKTNGMQYLSERNRLLWNVSKDEWIQRLRNSPLSFPGFLPGINSLRFTITDLLLAAAGKNRVISNVNSGDVDEFY